MLRREFLTLLARVAAVLPFARFLPRAAESQRLNRLTHIEGHGAQVYINGINVGEMKEATMTFVTPVELDVSEGDLAIVNWSGVDLVSYVLPITYSWVEERE